MLFLQRGDIPVPAPAEKLLPEPLPVDSKKQLEEAPEEPVAHKPLSGRQVRVQFAIFVFVLNRCRY